MNQTAWIVVAVVIVAALVVAGLMWSRRRRSDQLKSSFGREYDRAVEDKGDQSKALGRALPVFTRRGPGAADGGRLMADALAEPSNLCFATEEATEFRRKLPGSRTGAT